MFQAVRTNLSNVSRAYIARNVHPYASSLDTTPSFTEIKAQADVTNLVGVVRRSEIRANKWTPFTYLTPVVLCTSNNEPVVALRCWVWGTREEQIHFRMSAVERSNETFTIGADFWQSPYVLTNDLTSEVIPLNTRRPGCKEDRDFLKALIEGGTLESPTKQK